MPYAIRIVNYLMQSGLQRQLHEVIKGAVMRHRFETAAANLRRLYEERIGNAMTQKEFGKRIGISQSMVALILSGDRPLPLDLAPKFARELRCTIYDICPEMADYLREEVIPMLGKAMRRAAMVLLPVLALFAVAPQDAIASGFDNIRFTAAFVRQVVEVNMHCVSMLSNLVKRAIYFVRWLTGAAMTCGGLHCGQMGG